MCGVLLIDPKIPYNVGGAIRACSIFNVPYLRWTGLRVAEAMQRERDGSKAYKDRLPREERMKDYTNVYWREMDEEDAARPLDALARLGRITPVAVEVLPSAEWLDEFAHPQNALYVFGPEDGSLTAGIRSACHRFVRIRTATRTPLNLAQSVNIVLYDRWLKTR